MIIGVLGPEGSYSEKAAKGWIARQPNLVDIAINYYNDISGIFSALDGKAVNVGIVPVENSIEGSVGVSLDHLLENDVTIIGEIVIPIEHCLLSRGKRSGIKVILSHPQALAQCRQYLRENFKDVEIRTTGSTSHAAKLANEFEEMAAIASRESASMYGLDLLSENIQDRKRNSTRFIAITSDQSEDERASLLAGTERQSYKTSIIVYLDRDRPGALYDILGDFATRNINLTRIESRPSKRTLGDYVFYIDLSGDLGDAIIKDALHDINSKVSMLKILGSYPGYEMPWDE
ncbi:MAG: prephenate dehydratase [Methanosarcinaceae archaeon]|nr:prephenate dehydratase [Methanosarcinaceae archaeon]